ncbi:MAG: hypothetical protein H0W76_05520 [Pyrinomonadaceae bacterium]|nr:hypothetical protein [Pyrinomonadaceae bacterium]
MLPSVGSARSASSAVKLFVQLARSMKAARDLSGGATEVSVGNCGVRRGGVR